MAFVLAGLWAEQALAMQPCPPGSSAWHAWTISLVGLYVLVTLAGVALLARAGLRSQPRPKKVLLGATTLVALVLAAVGGLLLVMGISWTGSCV